ncbi:MAG: hypothetical protein FWF20_01125 [Betaproteobacteria bacterium]|nr:hypothetical protein [Betaproteobacteria bacterium]MCL2885383.1 hypothetical protein [Betaproteobacteria bacterium]
MVRLLKILAIILGSSWFFPVSCTSGVVVGARIIAKLDERHVERGDAVHSPFKIAAVPGVQGLPFRVLRLDEIKPDAAADAALALKKENIAFRMPAQSGSARIGQSMFSYQVLEDNGQEQFIELVEKQDDGDNTIWSRYRATSTSISPVGSRMFYFGYMFGALPYAFFGALILYGIGRFFRKRL